MKKYRNLLFDLDMTLLDFEQGEFNALKKALAPYNVEVTQENHKVYSAINKSYWLLLEKGELDKQELVKRRFPDFLKTIGRDDIDGIKLDRQYRDLLCEEAILMDGAIETLEELKNDYSFYLITNGTDYIQKSRIKKSGLDKYLSGVAISDEAHFPKPSKEFFDYFFAKFPVCADECLIIGDSLTSDILGGINYSIDTCLISDEKPESDIQPTYIIKSITSLIKLLK